MRNRSRESEGEFPTNGLVGTNPDDFLTVFAYRALGYFVNPLVGLLAMIVACELAVGVNRARRARLT